MGRHIVERMQQFLGHAETVLSQPGGKGGNRCGDARRHVDVVTVDVQIDGLIA